MNSALNPEAPEFYPHLSSVTQGGYSTVNKTIKSSNNLPYGASYAQFKTFTDFNIVACQLSENVVIQSNQILTTELPSVKLKRNDIEHNMDKIIDANDSMLDRVNINIDTLSGVNKNSDSFMENMKRNINISSWNKNSPVQPVIAKIKVGSTTFIGAKNIPRPQLTFKEPVDNSENLWIPKISDKPNNVKPLALNVLYNDEGVAVGYEHPYKVELELYHPPSEFIEPEPSPPTVPLPLEETKYTHIATEQQLDELVKHLENVKEMAVDVEHHSYRTYQGITCLIQITTNEGGDFIIDAIAIREHIHKLNVIFTNPKILKVLHGAESDVLWLQRDFGVYIVGLFDTHQAAKVLNLGRLSLKYLLMKYCGVDADKKYQVADWRIRPLPEELIQYARMDTHCLIYIWKKMKGDLLEAGMNQPHLLLSVFEQSRQICGTTYNKQVVHDNSHMSLYVPSKKSFNSQQMAALQLLFKWRDAQARILDESTMYLLPNHMLLALAENLPRELQGVNACCSPMPPFVKQNMITIHRMILSCRELPVEPQLYHMPTSIRNMVNTAHQALAYHIHDLSQFPDFRDDQIINFDYAAMFKEETNNFQPDITIFTQSYNADPNPVVVSDLNAEAKSFIPPYDRYRKYRSLAQVEEIKEYKDKEAKIAAISKGNELIKAEVLKKIHDAKTQIENEDTADVVKPIKPVTIEDLTKKKAEKRKRKLSSEKIDVKKESMQAYVTEESKSLPRSLRVKSTPNKDMKRFQYKNANYKKFYDSEKGNKQPKMKLKKRK